MGIVSNVKARLQNLIEENFVQGSFVQMARKLLQSLNKSNKPGNDYTSIVIEALENSKIDSKSDLEHKLEKDELTKIFNSQYKELKTRFDKLDDDNKCKNYEQYNGVIIPHNDVNKTIERSDNSKNSKVEET